MSGLDDSSMGCSSVQHGRNNRATRLLDGGSSERFPEHQIGNHFASGFSLQTGS
jgi:hypothetical protein